MKQAILSVTIDAKNDVEVRFQGDPSFHIPMMWAVDIAKVWLVDRIKSMQSIATSNGQTAEENQEKEVSKSEAIGAYLDARTKIEQRLQVIVQCHNTAKFKINDNLLSKL